MTSEIDKKLDVFALKCLNFAQKMHKSSLLNDLRGLWKKLTKDRRSGIFSYFRNPADRRAYLGYYFPVYVAKIVRLFQRLDEEGHLNGLKTKPLRILDLGSGTLTAVAASRLFFEKVQIEACAVDKSLAPMRLGLKMFSELFDKRALSRISLKQANLFGPKSAYLPSARPNLIVLGHVLNEMGQGPRALSRAHELIQSMMSVLDRDGLLLIVEPASQTATRFLMALRDRLIHEDQSVILAPCTGALECPLLKKKSSWCFSEFDWRKPKEFEKIDRQIGFKRETLKSSYLLVSSHGKTNEQQSRLVSGPMKQGNILRRYLCTLQGCKTIEQVQPEKKLLRAHTLLRGELLPTDLIQKDKMRIYTES